VDCGPGGPKHQEKNFVIRTAPMLRILGVLLFQNASPLKLVIPDVPQVTLRVGDSTVDVLAGAHLSTRGTMSIRF